MGGKAKVSPVVQTEIRIIEITLVLFVMPVLPVFQIIRILLSIYIAKHNRRAMPQQHNVPRGALYLLSPGKGLAAIMTDP